jgi:hypothetical protein
MTDRVEKYLAAVKCSVEHHLNHPSWGKGSLEYRVNMAYSEEHLEWLESFCKGVGFNMGCGEIPVKDSIGADPFLSLGSFNGAAYCHMDDLWNYEDECADYIISNYMESAPTPCKLFIEWYRLLKPGGVVAILCKDADDSSYDNTLIGPLSRSNKGGIKKFNCYTPRTMRFYLQFNKFKVDLITKEGVDLKVVAHK